MPEAFEHAKSQLASAPVLANYDVERQIKLAADASVYGLAQKVATATQRDPLLSQVYRYTQLGWTTEVDSVFLPFWNRQTELSLETDCLLWGI